MADNTFRSFRRDVSARDNATAARGAASDPLAELARLIGQNDARSSRGRDFAQPAATLGHSDWGSVDDKYAADQRDDEQDYAPQRAAELYETHSSDEPSDWVRDPREAEDHESAPHGYVASGAAYEALYADRLRGDGQDARLHEDDQSPSAQQTHYVHPDEDGGLAGELDLGLGGERAADRDEDDYDDYQEPATRRQRSGVVFVMAMLGLAVLGSASAFGYRAMFGDSLIPSLPPIITPGNAPIKIVPNHEAQGSGSGQADAQGTGDRLVAHEEQPVDVQSANPPPRVVTTIPVISNSPSLPSPNSPPPDVALNKPAPRAVEQLTSSIPPPSGSKPVHTVIIRPEQSANAAAAPPHNQAAAPQGAAAHQPKPVREAKPAREERRSAEGGPLSIVPNAEGALPRRAEPRERTAMLHSPEPESLSSRSGEQAAPAHGGYAVQVAAQRSEAEAMASFRAMQTKYPHQLGGRQAVVRRADLGAKGIYYRALIGPFASAEQASSLCSSLKTAGGSCLVQRN